MFDRLSDKLNAVFKKLKGRGKLSEAYKDVSGVVDVVQGAGIAKKVARLKPLGVIKG